MLNNNNNLGDLLSKAYTKELLKKMVQTPYYRRNTFPTLEVLYKTRAYKVIFYKDENIVKIFNKGQFWSIKVARGFVQGPLKKKLDFFELYEKIGR